MGRYLVNRKAGTVYIWTALLSKEEGLEEVFAENAGQALQKETIPDPRNITLAQIERMKKADIMMFAELKLKLRLSAELTLPQMQERVKEAIFAYADEAPKKPEAKPQEKAGAGVDAHQ